MAKMTTKENNIMIYNIEEDLNGLLDGLTDGEHIKATWERGEYLTTTEGPVRINGREVSSHGCIRWDDGIINTLLTSVEVARDKEVTIARKEEKALHELLDSLVEGEMITADWGTVEGAMSITGEVRTHGLLREVSGYGICGLRGRNGVLHHFLRSVTVRRTVVQHWEREGDE